MAIELTRVAAARGISSKGRRALWEEYRPVLAAQIEALQNADVPPLFAQASPMLSAIAFDEVAKPMTAGRRNPTDPAHLRAFTAVLKEVPHGTAAVGLKDMIAIAGRTPTAGLRTRTDRPADRDASVVASLREAGIGIQGMLDMDALAYGPTGMSSEIGPAVNALDPAVLPGGSSSGCGVAVAARLVDYAIGTDAGGSNRIPAALNGIAGFKPTYGRIPNDGVMPLAPSLDHLGPLARTVNDIAAVFSAIDPETTTGRGLAVDGTHEIVIGIPTSYFFAELDDATRADVEILLDMLRRDTGARVVEIDLPGVEMTGTAASLILGTEALQVNDDLLRTRPETIPDAVRLRLEVGLQIPSDAYEDARLYQRRWQSSVDSALAECHVILTPTLPINAPMIGQSMVDLTTVTLPTPTALTRLVSPFNLSGHPALSIPFPHSSNTIPLGVQLVGPRNYDSELLAVAQLIETIMGEGAVGLQDR